MTSVVWPVTTRIGMPVGGGRGHHSLHIATIQVKQPEVEDNRVRSGRLKVPERVNAVLY